MNSPASPLTSNNNQQFKRKKSEVNISANQDYYDINNPSSSFGQRLSSSTALSNSLGNGINGGLSIGLSNSKRNSTSFQPTSLYRRTSLTNLPGASQRKNSNFSSGTPTNSFAFANNNSNYTPTNSLTSSNINILNQRFTNMKTSYFDNPPLSRHNSITTINQNLMSTPGSHTSLSGMNSQRHPSYVNIPSEYFRPSKANGNESDTSSSVPVTPLNVIDLLPSSGKGTDRHNSSSSNESMDAPADDHMGRTQDDDQLVDMIHTTRDVDMDMGIDVHNNDFFENYTSIQTTEDFVIPSKMCNSIVGSLHKPGKSSLTDGLKNLASSKSNNKNDSTDLDWLKFEL
jgi:GATA-binding protein